MKIHIVRFITGLLLFCFLAEEVTDAAGLPFLKKTETFERKLMDSEEEKEEKKEAKEEKIEEKELLVKYFKITENGEKCRIFNNRVRSLVNECDKMCKSIDLPVEKRPPKAAA